MQMFKFRWGTTLQERVRHLTVSKECAAQSRDPTNSSCWFHFHTQVLCPPTIPCFSSGNSQFFNIILLWFHSRVTKNKHKKLGEEKMCVSPWLSCFEFYHVVARAITPSSQCWEGNLSWLVLSGFPHVPNYVFRGGCCPSREAEQNHLSHLSSQW